MRRSAIGQAKRDQVEVHVMSMLLTNWSGTRRLLDVAAETAKTYKRAIVESASDESGRILDAQLKRHPWRGDKVEIELRWTCERPLKLGKG